MFTPEIISICGLMLSSIVFYMYARRVDRETLTLNGFMVADSTLTKSQFSNTFVASNFSLGMAVVYFMGNVKTLGLFLFLSPATYLIGHFFFGWLIRETNMDIKNCRTLSDLVYLIFPSRAVALLITVMTVTSYIMLVFIELYIGSVLFSFFLPDNILYQTISFLGIGILVLLYVRLGGYKAIVATDKWQLFLMMSSILAVFIYSVLCPIVNGSDVKQLLINTTYYSEQNWFIVVFAGWLILVNSVTAFAQVANWQRFSASQNNDISWSGLIHSSWKVLLLFALTIVAFLLLSAKGYNTYSVTTFLQLVKDTGGISSYVLFPILVVGFASLVFSSADVALIAIGYALTDQNSFLKYFSGINEKKLRRVLTNTTLIILLILTAIFYLQFAGLQEWLMPLIYTTYGQLAVLTPIPIYVLLKLKKHGEMRPIEANRGNVFILFSSIVLACLVLFVGGYFAKVTGNQLYSLLVMPLGVLIVLCAIINIKKLKNFNFE